MMSRSHIRERVRVLKQKRKKIKKEKNKKKEKTKKEKNFFYLFILFRKKYVKNFFFFTEIMINEQVIFDNQEKELVKLHKSIKNILNISNQVLNEVYIQEHIIKKLENNLDTTKYKVNQTEKKTEKIVDDTKCCNLL